MTSATLVTTAPGLVTIDATAVSPKVTRASIGAAVASFVSAYVLSLLGRWSFFNSLGTATKLDVGAVLLAVITGLATFFIGYFTSHGAAVIRNVTTVLGADNVAVIRSDLKTAFAEAIAERTGLPELEAPPAVVAPVIVTPVVVTPTPVIDYAAPAPIPSAPVLTDVEVEDAAIEDESTLTTA